MLASGISGKVTAANTAVLRIRGLKEQIADRVQKGNDPLLKAAGDALTEKLTAVEGEIYQYRNRSGQDPLNFPIKLNNKLAALQGIVESGDFRPTDQSQAVFKELSAQLDVQLGKLDALIRNDLTAFNAMVVKKKLIIPGQPRSRRRRPASAGETEWRRRRGRARADRRGGRGRSCGGKRHIEIS